MWVAYIYFSKFFSFGQSCLASFTSILGPERRISILVMNPGLMVSTSYGKYFWNHTLEFSTLEGLKISCALVPWHFNMGPDPDLRIRTTYLRIRIQIRIRIRIRILLFSSVTFKIIISFFCLITFWRYIYNYSSKIKSHKEVTKQ